MTQAQILAAAVAAAGGTLSQPRAAGEACSPPTAAAVAAAAAAGQRAFRFDLGDGIVVDVAIDASTNPLTVSRSTLVEGLVDALSRAVAEKQGAPVNAELLERMRSAVVLLVDGALIPDARAAEAERQRQLQPPP